MAGAKGPNGPVAKCFGTGNRLRSPESLDCRQKASRKVLLVERTPLLFLMPYSYSWAERGPLCTAHTGSTQTGLCVASLVSGNRRPAYLCNGQLRCPATSRLTAISLPETSHLEMAMLMDSCVEVR